MKKIIVSLTAASLIVASAAAADKGIDIVTTGQTAVYYQTSANNGDAYNVTTTPTSTTAGTYSVKEGDNKLFNQAESKANVGVQLNLDADLKNDFTFGSQLTYIGTTGLEKNLVGNTVQNVGTATDTGNIAQEIALTQINVSKKIANTTVKIGRQELPMSLSPLAFSEDWNIFKNTFEAALVVNSDIPDTTLVGAYVGKSNKHGDLANFSDLTTSGTTIAGTAYMLTAQNKSIPMTTVTASYYTMAKIMTPAGYDILTVTPDADPVTGNYAFTDAYGSTDIEGANAVWGDIAIADKSLPMGLSFGLQGGQINPESNDLTNTTALGAKVAMKPVDALTLTAAYTTVNGEDYDADGNKKGQVQIRNVGTGVKTPLYTQMVLNQDAISLDANTIMLKAAYSLGDFGTITAQGSFTEAGESNFNTYRDNSGETKGNDFTDLELIYTVKAGGVDFLAAFVNTSYAEKTAAVDLATLGSTSSVSSEMDSVNTVRLWARYNF